MFLKYFLVVCVLAVGAFISVRSGKLTKAAGFTGWITAILVFMGAGFTGIAMMATFFFLGTLATSWHVNAKQKDGLAEKDKGRRVSGQVIANAGVAAILGLAAFLVPKYQEVLQIMMAASFASATADTLSSELGNVYGTKFYNIITGKKDKRGLDGVISVEGTLIGIAGSILIALIYAFASGFNSYFIFLVLAGTVGNLSDSILGATAERKGTVGNSTVNFLNTAIAAVFILIIFLINYYS